MIDDWWLVLPAAGIGRRMGADQPKQHLRIDQRTMVEVTLSRFIGLSGLKGAVLALAANDDLTPKLLASFSAFPLHFTPGGATRSDSVLASLNYLSDKDAARPCVRTEDVHKLLEAVRGSNAGGLLAVPVRDTLKQADERSQVSMTVPRDGVFHALTPQAFRLGALADAMNRAHQDGVTLTDESSAMEHVGMKPLLVKGHADNLKVTHPDDLPLARLILQAQSAQSGWIGGTSTSE
ncbi:MAG: 2-C-methyl-D-erythritol 4-phosphate cytidylyltransferase [Halothiobacillus sp. 15-55-196]|nr:MAG: 2-C-methyl-D-erythritol 4-phosphate cytidylyltransferase [Halothiobacillus sp. 15-55-196]